MNWVFTLKNPFKLPYYIFRYLRENYRSRRGINKLSTKLMAYLNYSDGFYVELGANDGISQSNTLYLEKSLNWRGVLVEPNNENYLKCVQNRSELNAIFRNACVGFDYKKASVNFLYADLMSISLELESDIANPELHQEIGLRFLPGNKNYLHFTAPASTLNNLLVDASAPTLIDLLVLDVEGAEMEVLKGIDHSKFKFKYMCIESRSSQKLFDYLYPLGYHFREKLTEQDYLFTITK
jgi:FkbM family methyltransferase